MNELHNILTSIANWAKATPFVETLSLLAGIMFGAVIAGWIIWNAIGIFANLLFARDKKADTIASAHFFGICINMALGVLLVIWTLPAYGNFVSLILIIPFAFIAAYLRFHGIHTVQRMVA